MAYYNGHHKGFGIQIAALCDYRMLFLDVTIGHLGRAHDASVYRACGMKARVEQHIAQSPGAGYYYITGDSAYPHSQVLLKEFSADEINEVRTRAPRDLQSCILYNIAFYSSRKFIEMAFGLLKIKWRILARLPVSRPGAHANQIVGACIALHNLCIRRHGYGRQYFEKWEGNYSEKKEIYDARYAFMDVGSLPRPDPALHRRAVYSRAAGQTRRAQVAVEAERLASRRELLYGEIEAGRMR